MAAPFPAGNPLATKPPDDQPIVDQNGKSTVLFKQWMRGVKRVLSPGITVTVSLAKLTAGGANGSLKVVNGIITQYTAPT